MQSHHIFCIFRVFCVFRGQLFGEISSVATNKKRGTRIHPRSAPLLTIVQLHTNMQFQTNCAWWRQVGVRHTVGARLAA